MPRAVPWQWHAQTAVTVDRTAVPALLLYLFRSFGYAGLDSVRINNTTGVYVQWVAFILPISVSGLDYHFILPPPSSYPDHYTRSRTTKVVSKRPIFEKTPLARS